MVKIERSEFFPVGQLEDKHNYKKVYRIKENGAIIERVILDVRMCHNESC